MAWQRKQRSESEDKAEVKRWQVLWSIVVLGGLSYATTFQTPFMFDGLYHIANNPGIRDLGNLEGIFFSGYGETRPVFMLSMALCYAVSGTNVWFYHLVNLLLHIGTALLLFSVSTQLQSLQLDEGEGAPVQQPSWLDWPALSALLFVVHPLATESVTYINSRSVLLMSFFGLLSLHSFLHWIKHGRRLSYTGALVAFLFALTSKESAAVLPFLFGFVVLLWAPSSTSRKRWLLGLVPFFVGLLLLPLLFLLVTNPHPPNPYIKLYPLWAHVLTQARIFGWFLLLSFVPFYHNFDYDFRWSNSLVDPSFWMTILAWASLLALGWRWRKRHPALLMGLLWFGFSLAPTNTLVLKDFMAERYLYGSLMGSAWVLSWFLLQLPQWVRMVRPNVVAALSMLVVLGFGGLTLARNEILRRPLRLWEHTVRQSPKKARVQINASIYLMKNKRFKRGLVHLKQALKLDPKDPYVHYNLGVFYERTQQWEKAVQAYKAAFELKPKKNYQTSLLMVHNRAGRWFFYKQQWKKAEHHFRAAMQLNPMFVNASYGLAMVMIFQKKWKEAEQQLKDVLLLQPQHRRARMNLSRVRAYLQKAKAKPTKR